MTAHVCKKWAQPFKSRSLFLQCRSQMPEFQRKARDAPFCSGFNGLRQLLSRRLLVTTSQVSASTHTLTQGIGWQPFRGSGRNKKHLQVQHCQQKPSRSQGMEWQGSLLAQRGNPVGAGDRVCLWGHGSCSQHISSSQMEARNCIPHGKLHCLSLPSPRKMQGGFFFLLKAKTQLMALMMNIKIKPCSSAIYWFVLV